MEKTLNQKVNEFAKAEILEMLYRCTEKQQNFFKRIFSHENPNLSLEEVVDIIKPDKIQGAHDICVRTLNQ
jgi:hypothetical protein